MIDYLLKFSSKRTAHTFARNNGFASINPITNEVSIVNASPDYALIEIGPHFIVSEEASDTHGESTVTTTSDNNYWVALRIMTANELPSTANKYIVWSSVSGVPRPKNDPTIPNINWA